MKTLQQARQLQIDARQFCFLIENINELSTEQWLGKISTLLPQIHAVIGLLERPHHTECLLPVADLDERFELFCRLKKFLGEKDGYELGEELVHHELYGSLADDLVDMYFEIKRGLDLIESDQRNLKDAIELWRDGFFLHWGKHLIDAERHLYELRVQHII